MTWMVQLKGDPPGLAALAQSLTGDDIRVSHNGQDYVLMSDYFASCDKASAVHQKAEEMIVYINGASRLVWDSMQPIRVSKIVYRRREDGILDTFIVSDPLVVRCQATGFFQNANSVSQWVKLARKHEAIAKVLRIVAEGTLDWVNLYRILEIIGKDVGSLRSIIKKGWATKLSMDLFKHTANSPEVSGLEARHGASEENPPQNPMAISEARSLINSIICAWLRSKNTEPKEVKGE
jgi:hypothetical protein